jgi:hypothetical protein
MLQAFVSGIYMSINQAQHYDQRPFRSMLVRGWIAYRPGRGLSHEGKAHSTCFITLKSREKISDAD